MSSGFSYHGGPSRCFAYWQEFQKCYIQTDNPVECRPLCGKYLDCLHHPYQQQQNPKVAKQDVEEHAK